MPLQGNSQDWWRARKRAALEQAKADRYTRANQATAAHLYAADIPQHQDEGLADSGPPLPWFGSCHSSHDLRHGGGLIFCSICGSCVVVEKDIIALKKPCRGWIPEGSEGRRNRLMRGQTPIASDTVWPDGRQSAIRIRMSTYSPDYLQPPEQEQSPRIGSAKMQIILTYWMCDLPLKL